MCLLVKKIYSKGDFSFIMGQGAKGVLKELGSSSVTGAEIEFVSSVANSAGDASTKHQTTQADLG